MPKLTMRDIGESQGRKDDAWGQLCPSKIFFDGAAVLTTSHLILPYNPKRIGLHLVGPNAGRVTVSHESPVVLDNGLTFSSTAGILSLYAFMAGMGLQKEWFAIYPAASTPLAWIEVEAPEEY